MSPTCSSLSCLFWTACSLHLALLCFNCSLPNYVLSSCILQNLPLLYSSFSKLPWLSTTWNLQGCFHKQFGKEFLLYLCSHNCYTQIQLVVRPIFIGLAFFPQGILASFQDFSWEFTISVWIRTKHFFSYLIAFKNCLLEMRKTLLLLFTSSFSLNRLKVYLFPLFPSVYVFALPSHKALLSNCQGLPNKTWHTLIGITSGQTSSLNEAIWKLSKHCSFSDTWWLYWSHDTL